MITDCLIRAIPGVIKKESYELETYSENNTFMFDFDSYTRPKEFDNLKVPEILLSGNHEKIIDWRNKNMKEKYNNYKNKI